jgi:hypothetical protein
LEALRNELNETNSRQEAYTILKNSFTEIEKRCVKHQKSEIEVKRQLVVYQDFIVSHPNPREIKYSFAFFF